MTSQRVLDAIERLERVHLLTEQMQESVNEGICDTSNPQAAAKSLTRRLTEIGNLVAEAIEKIGD